ncbi:MAG: T9SS type A sorting domain-containing protein [Bacteroidia bacterium]|nr:T9SS type A sorting domain-containing protein [Bacteroidia bacterium]
MKRLYISLITILFVQGSSFAQHKFSQWDVPSGANVYDITIDNVNNIWLATDNGVHRFSKDLKWTSFTKDDGLPENDVKAVAIRDGKVWLATINQGVAVFEGDKWVPKTIELPEGVDYISYFSDKVGASNTYYYGTNNGLVMEAKSPTEKPKKKNYNFAFQLGEITGVSLTKSNVLISRSLNGIGIEDVGLGISIGIGEGSALPDPRVLCGQVHNDFAYDGTAGGLYIPDFRNGAPPQGIDIIGTHNSDLPSNRIQAMHVSDRQEWYGTDKGLARKKGGSWEAITTQNSNLENHNVLELSVDARNQVWFVTGDGKLNRFEDVNSSVHDASLQSLSIKTSQADNHIYIGNLWHQNIEAKLYNLQGQEILTLEQTNEKVGFNMSGISTGIYVIRMEDLESGFGQTSKVFWTK